MCSIYGFYYHFIYSQIWIHYAIFPFDLNPLYFHSSLSLFLSPLFNFVLYIYSFVFSSPSYGINFCLNWYSPTRMYSPGCIRNGYCMPSQIWFRKMFACRDSRFEGRWMCCCSGKFEGWRPSSWSGLGCGPSRRLFERKRTLVQC